MKKIGIFGGSFSPPHIGHVRAAKSFISERHLDELHIIPAFLPPHKHIVGVTAEDRLTMCRLAFSSLKEAFILDTEIVRGGKSYTVLTLREYHEKGMHPELLIGTDMLLSFDRWYCYREIFSLCTLVCMRRESDELISEQLLSLTKRFENEGATIAFLNAPVTEISSSDIRNDMTNGRQNGYLPENVADYIRRKGLYRS